MPEVNKDISPQLDLSFLVLQDRSPCSEHYSLDSVEFYSNIGSKRPSTSKVYSFLCKARSSIYLFCMS